MRTSLALALVVVVVVATAAPAQLPFCPVVTDHAGDALEELFLADAVRVDSTLAVLATQDVTHHEVAVCIDPAGGLISGESRIEAVLRSEHLKLRLNETFEVRQVRTAAGAELAFERAGETLEVAMPDGGAGGDDPRDVVVSIRYDGTLARGNGVLLATGFVLLGVESRWHPVSPVHDPATMRIVARYPEGYASVATGALAGMAPSLEDRLDPCFGGDVWQVGSPVPGAAILVGAFESAMSVLGDVFMGYHRIAIPPGDPRSGRSGSFPIQSSELRDLVRFLEACYGPYPFDWIDVVLAPPETGGFASQAWGPGLIVIPSAGTSGGMSKRPHPARYVSDLSRSWWPFLVDAGPILSDGLAAWTELAWLTAIDDGEGAGRRREELLSDYVAALADSGGRAPLRSCLGNAESKDPRICRGKGAALFEMLELLIGRDAYCSALGTLGEEYAFRPAGLREVVAAFEAVADGELDWYFYEWVYRGDLPTYVLEYEVETTEAGGYLVRGTVGQEGEIYRTPLPLTIDLGVWSYEEWIAIESAEQTFEVRTTLEPFEVSVDELRIVPRIDARYRAQIHFELGLREGLENEWGLAAEEFGTAAALDPASSAYAFRLGEALVNSGRLAEGLSVLEDAVALDPSVFSRRLWLARLYLRLNDYESALAHLEAYVEGRPDDPAGHSERIVALVGLDRLDEADASVGVLLELRDRVGATGAGLPTTASEEVPGSMREKVYLAAGRFHEASGDTAAAIRAYEMALRSNPSSSEASKRLEALAHSGAPQRPGR